MGKNLIVKFQYVDSAGVEKKLTLHLLKIPVKSKQPAAPAHEHARTITDMRACVLILHIKTFTLHLNTIYVYDGIAVIDVDLIPIELN